MLMLVMGLVLFIGVHLLPTAPDIRLALGQRFGELVVKMAVSLVSILGLALIVIGYAKLGQMPGKNPVLWYPPSWTRHATFVLMLLAMILLVAAYVPSRIRDMAQHPMLAAVKLWALGHLLVRGDLGSMLLFGSLLAWAVYDRISVRKRGALGPLGRRTGTLGGDIAAVGGGIALYLFFLLVGHAKLIGVPLVTLSFAP